MPRRRAVLAGLGASVGLAGCLGEPPELDPQLPGFEDAANESAEETDPFAGIDFDKEPLRDRGDAIDFRVTAENTGTERQSITLRAFLYVDSNSEPIDTVDQVFSLRPGVKKQVGFPDGGILLSDSVLDRLTQLLINAKVGNFDSNYQELASYSGEDVRAVVDN